MTIKPKILPNRAADVRRIVILALSPVQMLDVVGPVEVFSQANRLYGNKPAPYCIELVGAEANEAVVATCGLSLVCPSYYRRLRGKVDTLLVAGGAGIREVEDVRLLTWLRRMSSRVRRMGSVCTGAFALAKAGIVNGRRVATHWAFAEELAALYPEVTVDPDPIWVKDGHLYSSAGITAGMDLALALVADDLGQEVALRVARQMVLFLHRPGGQSQFSVTLSHQLAERRPIRELTTWMAENLAGDLSLAALAERAGMSVRTFCRIFEKEQGISPGRYVQSLRLEAARRELERSNRGLKEIAADCGFRSGEVMRLIFQREFHTTPGAYRKRFRTKA